MKQRQTTKQRLRVRVALIVLAVLSALVVIATFGRTLPVSPNKPLTLNAPVAADSDGNRLAVVDSESRRLLILDKNHKLTGIVDCNALNAPIQAITDVCVTNNTVYVAGVQYEKDSDIIVKERVVAYDKHGTSEEILFDASMDNEEIPSIKTMDNDGEDVYFVLVNPVRGQGANKKSSSRITVMRANRDGSEIEEEQKIGIPSVFDIGYCHKTSEIKTISMRGVLDDTNGFNTKEALRESDGVAAQEVVESAATKEATGEETPFLGEHMFTSIDLADNKCAYLYDDTTSSLCSLREGKDLKKLSEEKGYSCVHVNGNFLTMCNRSANTVAVTDLNHINFQRISEVHVSTPLIVLMCVTHACRIYLALFALVLIVRKVRAAVQSGNTQGIGSLFASAAVVLVVTIAIGYISYGAYNTMVQTRGKEIDTFADYLSLTADQMSESMEACSNRDTYRKNNETLLSAYLNMLNIELRAVGLARVSTNNGIGTYVNVYGADKKGVFYVTESSNEHIMGGTVTAKNKDEIQKVFETNEASDEMYHGSTLRDATQYRLVAIPSADGLSTAGVIEVGSRLRTFEASLAGAQAQRILAVLVMVLVVYLAYAEIRACSRCFVSYRALKHHHDAIAVLTRPFSFFVTLLSSIDAVMTALIARSLLRAAGMDENGFLLALPAVMLGVGLAVGQAIYSFFGSRLVIKQLMTRGAIALVVFAITTAVVVYLGNYWLYCVAKLLMATPFGLLYTLSYSLPRRADTDEVRALAAGGIKRTDTSAAALGTVLGGYVAQELGNAWVYVLVAVVGVLVIIMATRIFPETKHPLEHEARAVESRRAALFKLITSKTTLPIIFFIMLPTILAAGYNSFVFPLFSSNLGIQTSAINNLFVLGQLVVYISITTIEGLEEHYDKWRVAGVSIALLSVVFLLFSFNTTLVWAVVTIALVGILCKASDGWKAMWPRSAKANGLTTGMATGAMFAVRSVLLIVQPLLLGGLMTFGNKTPVIVLGIICVVCSVAFFLTTRNSALAPNDKLSLEKELIRDDI